MGIIVMCFGVVFIGAGFRNLSPVEKESLKKHCTGYDVIEAGIGIDCYGDTIKLIKKHGFFEVASREANNSAFQSSLN